MFFDPFNEHSHQLNEGTVLISIRFRISWRGLDYLPPLAPIQVAPSEGREALLNAAEQLCRANTGDLSPTSAAYFRREALFYQWLEQWRLNRENFGVAPLEAVDSRVFAIIDCLAQHISIEPIDYPALQRAVGLSRAQINRVFQQGVGLTPRQWMVARCLDEAQRQIRHGGRSLKEIAAALGFFDTSHFTRWYRRQTGQTPTNWRIKQAF